MRLGHLASGCTATCTYVTTDGLEKNIDILLPRAQTSVYLICIDTDVFIEAAMTSSLVSVNSQPAKKSCVTLAMTRISENLYGQQSSTCASVPVDLRTMDTLLPPTRADPLAFSFIFIGVLVSC